jgi:DNA-directed RNA polymerase-3 subunit RPC5
VETEIEKERSPQSTEMKEVQFQFKKKQSERAMTAIQNSYAFKKQQINAESWRELHVFDPNVRLLLQLF